MNVAKTKAKAIEKHEARVKALSKVIRPTWKEERTEKTLRGNRFRVQSLWRNKSGQVVADAETNANIKTGEVSVTLISYEVS